MFTEQNTKVAFLTSLIILTAGCRNIFKHDKFLAADKADSFLTGDSGFIKKNAGIGFLLANGLTDTLKRPTSIWNIITSQDTIGRYFKDGHTGNFVACISDYSGKIPYLNYIVAEITPGCKLVKSEMYFSGCHTCGYNNYESQFGKFDKYYCLHSFETGAGFCADYVYLFKDIEPQDSLNSILLTFYSEFCFGKSCNLSSTTDINDTVIIMHYTYYTVQNDNTAPSEEPENFDVKYTLKKKNWATTNSAILDSLESDIF